MTSCKNHHDNDERSPGDVMEVLLVSLQRVQVGEETEGEHGQADCESGAEEQRSSWQL